MDHKHHSNHTVSEVFPDVSYNQGELIIELKDKSGKVPALEVSHEKIMHLIVMSSDLSDYHHLHPEDKGDGKYGQRIDLSNGNYKVFVDINPKDLNYFVKPIHISIGGTHKDSFKNKLVADTNFTKTINGQTVELNTDTMEVNREVTFNFDVKDATPEPYLGALGHVVITDEIGEKFIHVHPMSEKETVFMTQFDERGMYKMWVEFKLKGEVIVYPFVIEVQ
ncbi:hypothetical protein ACFSKI_14650 [Pseudogracilibacillus auburnensis]|uniref:Secreted protein n=1 Tax=Pseudogracilibacillus auburnensis TaxID=1494959 RepID=A0A2V3VPR1_9BACI|nr:hypothetical protein [Pseudogracilibacillus auburnensis]PXW83832.1 hypothetical protein DFR56_114117 [Pseudogracilibacillus auburnensis]